MCIYVCLCAHVCIKVYLCVFDSQNHIFLSRAAVNFYFIFHSMDAHMIEGWEKTNIFILFLVVMLYLLKWHRCFPLCCIFLGLIFFLRKQYKLTTNLRGKGESGDVYQQQRNSIVNPHN